jgi:hypothetical protein
MDVEPRSLALLAERQRVDGIAVSGGGFPVRGNPGDDPRRGS